MFSDNTDLFDEKIKKDIEFKMEFEKFAERRRKEIYDFFMKGFYEKLSSETDEDKS